MAADNNNLYDTELTLCQVPNEVCKPMISTPLNPYHYFYSQERNMFYPNLPLLFFKTY